MVNGIFVIRESLDFSREMWNALFYSRESWFHTQNANMADHSVGVRDKLHVFVFPMHPQETLALSSDLFCYISPCLRVAALMLLRTNFYHVARLRQSASKYWNTLFLVARKKYPNCPYSHSKTWSLFLFGVKICRAERTFHINHKLVSKTLVTSRFHRRLFFPFHSKTR